MFMKPVCTLVFSCLIISTKTESNNIRDECEALNRGNVAYECKEINECDSGDEILKSGTATKCKTDGAVLSICCRKLSRITKRQTAKQQAQESQNSRKRNDPYRIAQDNCIEYSAARVTFRPDFLGHVPRNETQFDCVQYENISVGSKAKPREFPHMALIGYHDQATGGKYEKWLCSGTLLSERYVLSAARCMKSSNVDAKWVRLGEITAGGHDDGVLKKKDYKIEQMIVHPKYKDSFIYHDIALFKLSTPVELNPYARPVCLHTSNIQTSIINKIPLATGYGITALGGQQTKSLLKSNMYLQTESECRKAYANDTKMPTGFDPTTMLCAVNKPDYHDTCPGDAGGSLQFTIVGWKCMWLQAGITSYGYGGCGKQKPVIYTKVSYYVPWIQSIVWPWSR